uniref:Uncharacterized protein n=1 Tax=Anguilla anguilla TaxID=7936 RepID=A0A0E9W449_ANGAN
MTTLTEDRRDRTTGEAGVNEAFKIRQIESVDLT